MSRVGCNVGMAERILFRAAHCHPKRIVALYRGRVEVFDNYLLHFRFGCYGVLGLFRIRQFGIEGIFISLFLSVYIYLVHPGGLDFDFQGRVPVGHDVEFEAVQGISLVGFGDEVTALVIVYHRSRFIEHPGGRVLQQGGCFVRFSFYVDGIAFDGFPQQYAFHIFHACYGHCCLC